MKGLQTRKKRFEESEYTTNEKQKEDFASLLRRIGINELNYVMITINCPNYISDWLEQYRYLNKFLKRIKIKYVACLEWCDQRSNGYHLHLIISRENMDFINIPTKTGYISELLVNNCLNRCLGYICKERKGCVVNEKKYYTNISERKLVPVAVRQMTKEESPTQTTEKHSIQADNHHQAKPKKMKLKVFIKDLIKKVKTFISRLFIKNQARYYYDYKKEIVCSSRRDSPT
jgi:hypothetical protein